MLTSSAQILCYHPDINLEEILERLEAAEHGWLVVIDQQGRYLGMITDGDVRRGILNRQYQVEDWIKPQPHIARPDQPVEGLLRKVKQAYGLCLPIVDKAGHLVDVIPVDEPRRRVRPNKVVLMVGGLGRRLGELTRDIPKPMLPLGHKPILHYILSSLVEYGFREFYFCVNYRAESIREYFGDGATFGAKIIYIEEPEPLGTAGGLGLIETPFETPFLVMNGDILTTLNFESLLQFHLEKEAVATMCTHEYNAQLPFGVVHMRQSKVLSLQEKPHYTYYVNAGIYVLNQRARQVITPGEPTDMTTVFDRLIEAEVPVHAYIINEFWMDIGQREDYLTSLRLFEGR